MGHRALYVGRIAPWLSSMETNNDYNAEILQAKDSNSSQKELQFNASMLYF